VLDMARCGAQCGSGWSGAGQSVLDTAQHGAQFGAGKDVVGQGRAALDTVWLRSEGCGVVR
jgi:hypothetical protein